MPPSPRYHPRYLHPLSLLVAAALGLAAPHRASAQALTCPDNGTRATTQASRKPGALADAAKLPIDLQADSWEGTVNGQINLTGNVQAHQGERTLTADALHYDMATKDMVATGTVQYDDSTLALSGTDANMSSSGGAEIKQAGFMLKATAGRGSAEKIQLSPDGTVSLDKVSYTTCPAGSADWELKLSDLDINQQTHTGTGRNVRLDFLGVPIFYTPWISFPVGNERKSGFLFPSFGGSSRGGNALSVPWYWNLAANYDDTITPTYDTSHGFKLDNEFRYLGESSKGTLLTGYLPSDQQHVRQNSATDPQVHSWRAWGQLTYRNDFTDVLRLDVNAGEVSDKQWFEDFGATRDINSTVYLTRALNLTAYSAHWQAELNVLNLQIIDNTTASVDRPSSLLPQLTLDGHQPLPFGADFALNSEFTYFTRGVLIDPSVADANTNKVLVEGQRLTALPTLSLPLRNAGMYVIPSASWHYTGYQLQRYTDAASAGTYNINANYALNRSPSISAPTYSLDTGMAFERMSGSKQQRILTLEPRLLYSYVPYRDQSDIPRIDTGLPDFNLVQLFQTNRFIGPDRLGDTQQLSAGVTTRMLDAADGRQFLSGTLGQAFYFKTPCVTALDQTTCSTATNDRSSDVIGQLSLSAYKNWNVNMGVQWDPDLGRSQRGDFSFQYRPANDRTVNLGYSYDRSSTDSQKWVEQWVSSFAWPISSSWSSYGRVVYSRLDRKFLDHFAGLEYRSCCWNIRAVVGRAVTTRSGEYDTQYKLQLELKGLSSVGTADTFLESSIPGYSARREQLSGASIP